MDRSNYGIAPFKRNKSAEATALRLCFETRSYLSQISEQSVTFRKTQEALRKYLTRVEQILRGEHKLSSKLNTVKEMADAFTTDGWDRLIIFNLDKFDFETTKELIEILSPLLRSSPDMRVNISNHVNEIISEIINYYEMDQTYVVAGPFFRELLTYEAIHSAALSLGTLQLFAQQVMSSQFEISADAFESVKALLSSKRFVRRFIDENYSEVMSIIDKFLNVSYFFKRQTLSLVYNLLENFPESSFAYTFITDREKLTEIMNMLKRESSIQIKTEAFYIFSAILEGLLRLRDQMEELPTFKIIRKNKLKLLSFFEKFQVERDDDEFQDCRRKVIDRLKRVV